MRRSCISMRKQKETGQTGFSVNNVSEINASVTCHIYIVSNVNHGIFFRSHAQSRGAFELNLKEIVLFLGVTITIHSHTHRKE